MEMAEELSRKNWELQLKQIRKDFNQLTNQEFQGFDPGLRELVCRMLGRLLVHSDIFNQEATGTG